MKNDAIHLSSNKIVIKNRNKFFFFWILSKELGRNGKPELINMFLNAEQTL